MSTNLDPNTSRKEFERILQQAHSLNKTMAAYVVQALTQTDAIKSARALDNAILTAEGIIQQFRVARSHLHVAAPGISFPPSGVPDFQPYRMKPPPPRTF